MAQIFGGFIACLLVYAQYKDLIVATEHALAAKGALAAIQFTPMGPAGIFGLYIPPGVSIGRVFLNEFVTVSYALTFSTSMLKHTYIGHLPRPRNLGSDRPYKCSSPTCCGPMGSQLCIVRTGFRRQLLLFSPQFQCRRYLGLCSTWL
jgi:hypothetical protein